MYSGSGRKALFFHLEATLVGALACALQDGLYLEGMRPSPESLDLQGEVRHEPSAGPVQMHSFSMQMHTPMHSFTHHQISIIEHRTGHKSRGDAHRHYQSYNQEDSYVKTEI